MEVNHTTEEWPELDYRWWSAALIVGAASISGLIYLLCKIVGSFA